MSEFNVKDHGVREEMKTGSVRDTQQGKPRYDLVPATCLTKLALHYGAGSEKYGDRNWEKGQPITRYMSSAERHFQYFKMGLTDENHLMACVWNLFCIDWTLDQIATGKLPKELDDRTPEMLGGKICLDLFSKIEENIKSKIGKSVKIDEKKFEKCDKTDKIILEKCDKKLENVKNNKDKNLEKVIKDIFGDKKVFEEPLDKPIKINVDKDDVLPIISLKDDSFATICLTSGRFITHDDGKIRYSKAKVDFFDVNNDCIEKDMFFKEMKRLVDNKVKFVLIAEDVFDWVMCEKRLGILFGYNTKDKTLERICEVDDFNFADIDEKLFEKYTIFTVGSKVI